MFTGLIENVGSITDIRKRGDYRLLTITAPFKDEPVRIGESIAVDGACLTVVKFATDRFVVEVSSETFDRTILGIYRTGSKVNLERAVRLGDRLGGHLVSGHVDERGKIEAIRCKGGSLEISIRFDSRYDNLVIEKGSIAINGVSLTINSVAPGRLTVNIIPHTARETTSEEMNVGDPVNIEFDMIGKYIVKAQERTRQGTLSVEKLINSGW